VFVFDYLYVLNSYYYYYYSIDASKGVLKIGDVAQFKSNTRVGVLVKRFLYSSIEYYLYIYIFKKAKLLRRALSSLMALKGIKN
jgi:hypothetical protein